MKEFEVNFDGLVGPTHNYAGLSFGNVASTKHKNLLANPKEAALQGLEKMIALHRLGIKQGVFPPHERPYAPLLRRLGYQEVHDVPSDLLAAASSSAAMWTANAATVCPSSDSQDGKVHFTPANLCTNIHRLIETTTTSEILKKAFPFATHHEPLPSTPVFSDEGAANHTRFSGGLQLFVYGKNEATRKFPARQSLEASKAIARLHRLNPQKTLFAEQHPEAIDAGVFHNDVISVGFENIFFYHERAFLHTEPTLLELKSHLPNLIDIRVNEHDLSLEKAVNSYLFNSQIVKDKNENLLLIAPIECQNDPEISSFLKNTPFDAIHYFDLKQSMQNGGGPACLRLRVLLNEKEIEKTHQKLLLTEELYEKLKKWIHAHYRDSLIQEDLKDPQLLKESKTALDELTKLLELGSLYDFQK